MNATKNPKQEPTSKSSKTISWHRSTYEEVELIYRLAHTQFGVEVNRLMSLSPDKFRYMVAQAILKQNYDPNSEFLISAYHDDKFIGYAWLSRGTSTTFSNDEIADAKFIHVALEASPRVRVQIVKEALEQFQLWCLINNIPVLCSTSVRADWQTFMRIHEKMDFTVMGTYAWKRITPL
jgi:hypothetical protein